jgi:LPXTG-motif cell wall-anchored protein
VLGESESRSTGSTAGELAATGRTTGPLTLAGAALVLGGALLLALRARRSARPAPYSSIV